MATTPGYDPKKAALFNQLRQGGLSEDAAVAQAGITDAETTNYAIGMNGQMGALIIGAGTRPGVEIVRTVDYDEKADAPVSSKTPTNYTTTSTETVSGGGSTTIIAGARQPTPASQAFAAEGDAKQAEIDQFSRENPSNFMRKRQGLPALTPEENEARIAKLNTLQDQRSQIYNQQLAAENVSPPTVITVPNTTTTTQTVTSGTTSVNTAVPAPAGADPVINQQTEQQLGVAVGAANENTTATAVGNTSDPYAASREAALLEANDIPVTKTDVASDPNTNPNGEVASQAEQIQSQNAQALASDPNTNPNGEAGSQTEIAAQIQNQNAQALASDPNTNVGGTVEQRTQSEQIQNQNAQALASDPNTNVGGEVEQRPRTIEDDTGSSIQQAAKLRAQAQASLQQQRKQANDGDWRVRLRLAPGANYLYRATDGKGTQAGILQPLAVTDGVIFPYTPQIQTGYRANYNTYDLTHSNYRGYFYQGSQVEEINITAVFTAQDTAEANYMLAVIHFFKSVTKMFYGQDAERGAPPPLVFLQGLGEFQFNLHPCVVTNFTYNLPNDVDYIRARSTNINGNDLLRRRDRQTVATNPFSAAWDRLQSIGAPKGAINKPPATPTLGMNSPTYVPTKIDLQLTLLPIQSREQVSKEFSLKNYANGNLLKGGFW